MLRLCSISSGSKGNCIYVSGEHTGVLIDGGVSLKRIDGALKKLGGAPLTDLLLTHTHSDHYKFVPALAQKGMTVYGSPSLASKVRGDLGAKYQPVLQDTYIGDLLVSAFPVSHDVPCSGYSLYSCGSKVSVVTDLGRMAHSTLEQIADSDAVVIESNYDVKRMAENTTYPPQLKRRITSAIGHLSNDDCAECVAYLAGHGVKHIILAHLSEENNTPDLAMNASQNALIRYNLANKTDIHIATQNEMSIVIEV